MKCFPRYLLLPPPPPPQHVALTVAFLLLAIPQHGSWHLLQPCPPPAWPVVVAEFPMIPVAHSGPQERLHTPPHGAGWGRSAGGYTNWTLAEPPPSPEPFDHVTTLFFPVELLIGRRKMLRGRQATGDGAGRTHIQTWGLDRQTATDVGAERTDRREHSHSHRPTRGKAKILHHPLLLSCVTLHLSLATRHYPLVTSRPSPAKGLRHIR